MTTSFVQVSSSSSNLTNGDFFSKHNIYAKLSFNLYLFMIVEIYVLPKNSCHSNIIIISFHIAISFFKYNLFNNNNSIIYSICPSYLHWFEILPMCTELFLEFYFCSIDLSTNMGFFCHYHTVLIYVTIFYYFIQNFICLFIFPIWTKDSVCLDSCKIILAFYCYFAIRLLKENRCILYWAFLSKNIMKFSIFKSLHHSVMY